VNDLALPAAPYEVGRLRMGARFAEMILGGLLYSPKEAHTIGLVNKLVEGDVVEECHKDLSKNFVGRNLGGWRAMKDLNISPTMTVLQNDDYVNERDGTFLHSYFLGGGKQWMMEQVKSLDKNKTKD